MSTVASKKKAQKARKIRVRAKIHGSAVRPRLAVFKSARVGTRGRGRLRGVLGVLRAVLNAGRGSEKRGRQKVQHVFDPSLSGPHLD